jgi:hypothetical protein
MSSMTAPSPYAPPSAGPPSGLPNVESRRRLVHGIAVVVYAIFFILAYGIVRGTLGWVCDEGGWCISSSAPWVFWLSLPVFPALAAWLAARRLLDGPSVGRHDLTVFFSAPPVGREGGPCIGDLLAGLAELGYAPRAFVLDDLLRPSSVATGTEPLLGPRFLLLEEHSRARRAFLRLMLSAGEAKGTGIIEVSDSAQGLYAELASYIVRDLAPSLPDLRFRRYDSGLSPETAHSLVLPARPAHLV